MRLETSAAVFDKRCAGRHRAGDPSRRCGPVDRSGRRRDGASEDELHAAFERLAAAKVFIARPGSSETLAFNPFAADPTEFRVTAGGRDWWAICAWDALGFPAALGADGAIAAKCGDCGDAIELRVRRGAVDGPAGVVLQFGLPALAWWKDIIFT